MIDFASFTTTADEVRVMARIARRAASMGIKRQHLDLMMDLEAAHRVCPLKLADLEHAADADFAHDVCGIIQHLDRDTGEIGGCFRPRYAV